MALFAEPIIGLIIGGVGSTVVLLILLVIGVRVHNNNNRHNSRNNNHNSSGNSCNNNNNRDSPDDTSGTLSCTTGAGNYSGNTSALSSAGGVSIAPPYSSTSSTNALHHSLHNSHSIASFITNDNCNILSTATLGRSNNTYRATTVGTTGTCSIATAFASPSTTPLPPSHTSYHNSNCHTGHRGSSLSQLIVSSGNSSNLTCITPPPPPLPPCNSSILTPLANMKVNISATGESCVGVCVALYRSPITDLSLSLPLSTSGPLLNDCINTSSNSPSDYSSILHHNAINYLHHQNVANSYATTACTGGGSIGSDSMDGSTSGIVGGCTYGTITRSSALKYCGSGHRNTVMLPSHDTTVQCSELQHNSNSNSNSSNVNCYSSRNATKSGMCTRYHRDV